VTTGALRPFRIAIRADARADLGGGHIMRCLTLADALSQRGCEIAFACCPGSAELVPALANAPYPVLDADNPGHLPLPAHWRGRTDGIIIDLYDASQEDEARLRKRCNVLTTYGELLHRQHVCDVLIDQNMGRHGELHAERVEGGARFLLGPAYFAARREFNTLRPAALERRQSPRLSRILITMGLTDLDAISLRLARAALTASNAEIEVILGPEAPSRAPLDTLAANEPRLTITIGANDMAHRMARADLAIGAGGGTAFERCILGLPSLVCVLADNQAALATALDAAGAAICLSADQPLETQIQHHLSRLSAADLRIMSDHAARVCDGRGAERVADAILDGLQARALSLRPAVSADEDRVLAWRNSDHVRSNMYVPDVIAPEEHQAWFTETLSGKGRQLMILSKGDEAVGVILLYDLDFTDKSCRWAFYVGEQSALGRGIGRELEQATLDYVFDDLQLKHLQCEVLRENGAVLALHRAFGFREIPFPADSSTSAADQSRAVCLQIDRDDWC
jgi:UDP-2,4-diacetamido-2,4,6-trideoxy-beta-L-altropyranose hydrolase